MSYLNFRIRQLCEKWEKVLSHGIRTNLSNSAIQNFVTAGLNFTFNIINVGKHKLHLTYICLHIIIMSNDVDFSTCSF